MKISFCITCMNRLYHIQETLRKNIEDNYLLNEVEFVLLDYNSSDGLEEWVTSEMQACIDNGILVYYKTVTPQHYHRSHSRNIVFRLAKGNILCNLDADNYLGNGFAAEMIKEFEQKRNLFYTSDLSSSDAYGRVCVLRDDFLTIRGYNESLSGYGHEDADLFARLTKHGLKHLQYRNPKFNNAIKHSKLERINNEEIYNKLMFAYVSYIDPFTTKALLLYNDETCEYMTLIEREYGRMIKNPANEITKTQKTNRIFLKEDPQKGEWTKLSNCTISLKYNDKRIEFAVGASSFKIGNRSFYKLEEQELITTIVLVAGMAVNQNRALRMRNSNETVNPDGFGRDKVYKGFNSDECIILD